MIKLEKAATKIMAAIGTAVMLFLLFYSWKYTKRLVEPEYYLDEKDSILWNALVGVVLVAVCGALSGVMKKIPAWALHLLAVLGASAMARPKPPVATTFSSASPLSSFTLRMM